MAKRIGHFTEIKNKKTKIDNGVDNLWNDCNFDNIDECLILATQRCEQSSLVAATNNSTLNYSNIFDHTDVNVYTSTQVINANKVERLPISNGSVHKETQEDKIKQLEAQIKTLTQKIECKDGEVSILRTQMKELKTHSDQEHHKNEKENLEKIDALTRDMLAIKSQLDFKNLEIINLKSTKCLLTQQNQQDFNINNSTTTFDVKGVHKLYTILDTRCQSTDLLSQNMFFCDKRVSQFLDGHTPTGNHTAQDDFAISDIAVTLNHTLSLLRNCLEIREYYMLGKNGQGCVKIQENPLCDMRSGCIGDIEGRASQLVTIVAKILPYTYCLRKSLLSSLNLDFDPLRDIKRILNLIRRTKMTEIVSGFLHAVAELLLKISQTEAFTNSRSPPPIILDVYNELLLTRPPVVVLTKQLMFLKQASAAADSQFVNAICKMFPLTPSYLPIGENILSEQDNCLLQSMAGLYQDRVIEQGYFNIRASENVLQLIMILLNYNISFFQSDTSDISHNCVCKLTILGINVIHDLVNNYKRNSKLITHDERQRYMATFKYCINLLHIVGFKYFDVINKYFVDSQYKFIVNYIYWSRNVLGLTEFKDEALRDLNIQEDACHINSANFDKIPVWN